jgi:hypothetical protein
MVLAQQRMREISFEKGKLFSYPKREGSTSPRPIERRIRRRNRVNRGVPGNDFIDVAP